MGSVILGIILVAIIAFIVGRLLSLRKLAISKDKELTEAEIKEQKNNAYILGCILIGVGLLSTLFLSLIEVDQLLDPYTKSTPVANAIGVIISSIGVVILVWGRITRTGRIKSKIIAKILFLFGSIITVIGILWVSSYIAGAYIFNPGRLDHWHTLWMDDGFKYGVYCTILGIVTLLFAIVFRYYPSRIAIIAKTITRAVKRIKTGNR